MIDTPLDQLKLACQVLKLRIRMHEYFDQEFQMKSCENTLVETMKEEQLMVSECISRCKRMNSETNFIIETKT